MNVARLFAMGAALCAVSVLTTTAAEAARRARASDVVRISGCTTHVPPFCIGVHFRGTAYVLSSVTPITIGTGVKVVGRKTGQPGVCGGTALQVVSWQPTRRVCK
ncbi:MAG: hypothetical protein AB1490_04025 [Pseudomonadota bacterium]